MKKLLGILTSLSLVAVASTNVVACNSNPYDKTSDDGDSILINNIGELNFGTGKSYIDTSDILNKIIETGGNSALRGKLIGRFINLIGAGFLAKANTLTTTDEQKDWFGGDVKSNPYLNQGLVAKMKTAFTEVQAAAENELKTQKNSYKDKYGKKYKDKWSDMLESQFPGFKDIDQLENKFIVNQMLNGTDNINSRLLEILLNTNQTGIQWIGNGTIKQYFNEYKALNATDKDNLETVQKQWIKDNESKAKQIVWSFSTIETNKYAYGTYTDFASDDEIYTELTTIIGDSDTYKTSIMKDAPDSIDSLSTNNAKSSASEGFLSNSQRYFLDQYYKREAPVAISQINIPFETDGKMDDGIQVEDFYNSKTPTPDQTLKYEDYSSFLESDNLNSNWNKLLGGQTFNNITKSDTSSLLTLSASTSTYSQMLKNVVYNYINNPTSATQISYKNFGDLASEIAKSASRSSENTMYVKLADGILAFVDSSGLEIVRIEGYNVLANSIENLKNNKGVVGNEVVTTDNFLMDNDSNTTAKTKINEDTLKELTAFKTFAGNTSDGNWTDANKVDIIQNLGPVYGTSSNNSLYSIMNSEVSNPYLHFLVNQSLLKGISGAYTSFDIMSDVKSYVTISEPQSGSTYTFWTAIIDYMYEIEKTRKGNLEFEEFIGEYVTAGNDDSSSNDDSIQELYNICVRGLNTVKTNESNDNIEQFIAAQETENNSITNNTNKGYPKGVFPKFEESGLETLLTTKWKTYLDNNNSLNLNSYFMNYLKGGK